MMLLEACSHFSCVCRVAIEEFKQKKLPSSILDLYSEYSLATVHFVEKHT